jgi:hypothetical protein
MIYYETLVLFFVLLGIIAIIIGFVVKNRPIRYFFWLLSIPVLFLTISTINKYSYAANKQTSLFLGTYKIDTSKSVYRYYTLVNHQNLTMIVKPNKTFEFSDTSMFPSKNGSWKFYPTEDGGFVKCGFSDRKYESLVFANGEFWGFQHDCFRNGKNDDIIYFKKQTEK